MRIKLLLAALAVFFFSVFINTGGYRRTMVIANDKGSYYVYLPAVFIAHDLPNLDFVGRIDAIYKENGNDSFYSMYRSPVTHHRFTKYPAGTALCEMPMFLMAHAIADNTHIDEPDGYSGIYRIAISLSAILFVMLGLWALYRFLVRYFSPASAFYTALSIALGTNLFLYTAFDPGMSHPYSFAFTALLLYATERWTTEKRPGMALLTGFCYGMLVIIRPVNALLLVIPLCWKIYDGASLRARLAFYKEQYRAILLASLLAFAVLSIQMAYWKMATGHWIYYSYENEKFTFDNPQIWNGLFSYKKGWFVYTPLAFVAMLGFVPLYRRHREWVPVLLATLCLYIYVVFSWQQWWYGGGFGARPLIDILALTAIPLAALFDWFGTLRRPLRAVCCTAIGLLIVLSLFQTWQFNRGIIHWDSMNRAYYWRIFGKPEITEEDSKLLDQ